MRTPPNRRVGWVARRRRPDRALRRPPGARPWPRRPPGRRAADQCATRGLRRPPRGSAPGAVSSSTGPGDTNALVGVLRDGDPRSLAVPRRHRGAGRRVAGGRRGPRDPPRRPGRARTWTRILQLPTVARLAEPPRVDRRVRGVTPIAGRERARNVTCCAGTRRSTCVGHGCTIDPAADPRAARRAGRWPDRPNGGAVARASARLLPRRGRATWTGTTAPS